MKRKITMNENFTLNLVRNIGWFDYVLNLNGFSKEVFDEYYYNTEKSTEKKKVFSLKNAKKMFAKKCGKALILILAKLFLLYIFVELVDSELGVIIGQVLLLSVLLDLFSIIRIPFVTTSSLIFSQDSKHHEIIKQNIFPVFSDNLFLTSPDRPIGRIVFSKKNGYTVITFRQKKDDVIPYNAPVLAIDSSNQEQLQETESFLKSYTENIENPISIVKL